MKHLLTISMFLAISTNLFAQYKISGRVVESESKSAIALSTIILYLGSESTHTTTSNSDGEFEFGSVAANSYTMMVVTSKYDIFSRDITVSGDEDLGEIVVNATSLELEEVEVVGRRQQTIYKLDKRIISAASNLVAAAGGSATDILSRVPSIRVDLVEGEVSFRGSSGFVIQVDGKPSIYDSAQALRQIPASQIENIEIISTPSARNQSDGDAGIINIITKKGEKDQFMGVINGYGSTLGSHGVDFMLNKNRGKNSFKLNGVYSEQYLKSDFDQYKVTVVDDITTTSKSNGERVGNYSTYTMSAGWEHNRDKASYSIDILGGYDSTNREGDLDYTELDGDNSQDYISSDYYLNDETIAVGTVGFTHKLKGEGHNLSVYGYYKYGGDSGETFRSNLLNLDGTRAQGHEALESEYRQTIQAKVDYTLPYSQSGRVEIGYNYDSYLEDGDYQMIYWNPDTQVFDYRDDIYNTFLFRRDINSVYTMVNQAVGRFEIQAGLRGEHTHQILESSQDWANRTVNRFDFFPSAHIACNSGENSSITAAYSRRINRAQLFYMEPYVTYRDYFTSEIGNPDIRSEYINAFEIAYKQNFSNDISLQLTAFHRARRDKIERLRVSSQVAGITLDSMSNVGDDYSTGLEFGLNMGVGRVWNFMFSGSVYHYKLNNNIPELGGEDETSVNYDLNLSNSFRITPTTTAQLDGYLVGPTVRTQGHSDGYFYADIALRQTLLKGQMSLDLNFKNFANSAKYGDYIDTDDLISYTHISPKFPTITLGISYRFNSFEGSNSRKNVGIFEGTNY